MHAYSSNDADACISGAFQVLKTQTFEGRLETDYLPELMREHTN